MPSQAMLARVPYAVAGNNYVTTDNLRAKLGDTAYYVYRALLTHWRKPDGSVFATRQDMGNTPGFQKFSDSAVKRALALLETAGLVQAKGRVWVGDGPTARFLMRRVVYGTQTTTASLGLCYTVPASTRMWMQTAQAKTARDGTARGGARTNAGKHSARQARDERGHFLPLRDDQKDAKMHDQDPSKQTHGTRANRPMAPEQTGPTCKTDHEVTKDRTGFSPNGERPAPAAAPPVQELRPLPAELGQRLGSTRARRPTWTQFLEMPGKFDGAAIPPYPSGNLIPVPTIPSPPKLPADADDVTLARRLARTYEAALEAVYGVKSWAFRRGDIEASKYYPMLVAAGRYLRDHEIAPASWIAFSLDVWRRYDKRDSKGKIQSPPLKWIFSLDRLRDREGWFRQEEDLYQGGQTIIGDAHRELAKRHTALQFELLHLEYNDVAGAAAAADRWFPGDLWDVLLDQAQAAANEKQHELKQAAARGAWLWARG